MTKEECLKNNLDCEYCVYSKAKRYPKDYCDIVVYKCTAFDGYGKIAYFPKLNNLFFNPRWKK